MYIDYKMDKDAEGKDHVLPTKYDFTFDIKDGAHFNLSNLFNGNKDLSKFLLLLLLPGLKTCFEGFKPN